MKFGSKFLLMVLLTASWSLQAQYDDVYYDPNYTARKKARVNNSRNYSSDYSTSNDNEYYNEYSTDHDGYDADNYDYYNSDDYSYTNRIRRFSRPLAGRGFYDPYYLDPWYYDPYYYTSGFGFSTPWIGIGFYSYNDYWRWNRWNRFNSLRYWDPFTYSYNPFGFNYFNNYFWATNSWCPTSWYSNSFYRGNNFFYTNNYWGNRYNNVYQPRYYTDNNIHFGPRTYGSTTTSDRGPSRSSSRVFSDPGTPGLNNGTTGLRRTSPRDADVTTVRERNTPLSRNPQGSIDDNGTSGNGANGRMSPRSSNENIVRERVQSTDRPRTFSDFERNSGSTDRTYDNQGSQRTTPRFNDNSRSTERSRSYEPSAPSRQFQNQNDNFEGGSIRSNRSERFESPRSESPRFNSPRNESPRFNSPGNESQRFNTPRNESPRFESPRNESPRFNSPRNESPRSFDSGRSFEAPRSNNSGGGSFGGGASGSGNSSGGGSVRSSPRSNN